MLQPQIEKRRHSAASELMNSKHSSNLWRCCHKIKFGNILSRFSVYNVYYISRIFLLQSRSFTGSRAASVYIGGWTHNDSNRINVVNIFFRCQICHAFYASKNPAFIFLTTENRLKIKLSWIFLCCLMIVFIKLSDLTPEPKYFHQDLLGTKLRYIWGWCFLILFINNSCWRTGPDVRVLAL